MREYLSPRAMAVVGASNARGKFGNLVCRELKARGFRVYPVNPHEKEICSERCYRTINELGDRIDRILIVLPPDVTRQLVRNLDSEFVSYVWMQNGAESAEAIRISNAKGIKTIYGQCILMHAQPVRSYHLLHRWWAMSVHSQFSMVRLHCKGESWCNIMTEAPFYAEKEVGFDGILFQILP
jgi:predicted CoA-binding protein